MPNTDSPQQDTHFSDSEWVDFIHNLLPPSRERELRSHVTSDCAVCLRSFQFWHDIERSLSAQVELPAPLPLVVAAQELFHTRGPWNWLRASADWASTVFDSFWQPLPAAIRGSTTDVRHLIYDAEPYVIDVTVRADPAQASLFLLGQIMNAQTSGVFAGEEIHVVLLSGEQLVAKTLAASSGEFELCCERSADLNLFISVSGERAIGLSLADSGEANSA